MALVIILLIAGLMLLALETLLPGLIAGIAGLVCVVLAVVLAYRQLGMTTGNIILVTAGGCLVVGVFAWFRFLPGSRFGRRFVSHGAVGELGVEQRELFNQRGRALTNLRPSGMALINGRRIDVVTEGAMVERGSPIRVVAVEGMRVIVRAMEDSP